MNENEKEAYLEVDDSPIARILHYLAITATSDELLEALLLDMQSLGIAILPQLLSDARNTFNTLPQQGTNNNVNSLLNLAQAGNDQLIEYATLKEYMPIGKIKNVLIIF